MVLQHSLMDEESFNQLISPDRITRLGTPDKKTGKQNK